MGSQSPTTLACPNCGGPHVDWHRDAKPFLVNGFIKYWASNRIDLSCPTCGHRWHVDRNDTSTPAPPPNRSGGHLPNGNEQFATE